MRHRMRTVPLPRARFTQTETGPFKTAFAWPFRNAAAAFDCCVAQPSPPESENETKITVEERIQTHLALETASGAPASTKKHAGPLHQNMYNPTRAHCGPVLIPAFALNQIAIRTTGTSVP